MAASPPFPPPAAHEELERFGLGELGLRRSEKWQRPDPSVIAAGIAEMDFPLAPAVTGALADLVERSDLGYPTPDLQQAVLEAFCARWASRHGAALDPGRAALATDVVQGIALTLSTCTEPGAGVVVLTPAYPPFFEVIAGSGRRVIACDLVGGATGYEVDIDALRAVSRSGRASALLLCNPHNPTGTVFRRDELEAIGEIALELGLLVVADEIHADLVLEGPPVSSISSLGAEVAGRAVTLGSASKAFNLAGLRCAVVGFGSERLALSYATVPGRQRGSISLPGIVATLAAFRSADDWLDAVVAYLRANRDRVADVLAAELGAGVLRPPAATYLAWLDLSGFGLGDDPAAGLVSSGALLAPGPTFGAAGAGHARLNFATPRPVLDELLRRVVAGCRAPR